MDELIALVGSSVVASVVAIIILVIFLPQVITTWVMSYKGYSGCLWLFFSFFLSWIGVIIAICMPNVRRQEERHRETIAAMVSQNRSQTVIVNNQENEQTQHFPSSPAIDFRLQAIRNLKTIGKPFDDYDLELEIEKIKKEYEEFRLKEVAQREREQQEEQARTEEEQRNRQLIRNERRTKILTKLSIVVGAIFLLTVLSFSVVYFLQNRKSTQEEIQAVNDLNQHDNPAFLTKTDTYSWIRIEGEGLWKPLKTQIFFGQTEIKCITDKETNLFIITGKPEQKKDDEGVFMEYHVYYSTDTNQKIMRIVRGADFTTLIYNDEGYYEIYSKTKPKQGNIDNIEDILPQLVVEWNGAHSLDFVNLFADLYNSNVSFYGTTLNKDKVYSKKQSSLQKSNGYKQEILDNNIDVKQINDNEYRCDFVKRVSVNKKTNDYPSYLVFRKFNNEWKIVVESDEITDKNLVKRKVDEILNFPEVKAIKNVVIDTFEPTDGELYYTVRVGADMETHVTACYWFRVYENTYQIMYYDVATDSEMTLEQWRKRGK
ncbi:MAG: hypothetical protein LBU51_10960 [Bacteroidales bacterium]|jgi:preprotein translocase subunit SecG|nr:hypothetical protein [Bacteroidales bacterium]